MTTDDPELDGLEELLQQAYKKRDEAMDKRPSRKKSCFVIMCAIIVLTPLLWPTGADAIDWGPWAPWGLIIWFSATELLLGICVNPGGIVQGICTNPIEFLSGIVNTFFPYPIWLIVLNTLVSPWLLWWIMFKIGRKPADSP